MKVAVVGGGIVGIATTHVLLDSGHEVTILDPRGFAQGASAGNAGWIAHLDVLPLASSKAWRQVPGWLLDPLGPFAIRPSYLPRITPWLLRFAAASRPARVRASTEAITALNRLALPAWERLLGRLNLAGHLRRRGLLSVWTSQAAFNAATSTIAYQRCHGIPVTTLDAAGVRALEPALRGPVVAGAHYETGCHVSDPQRFALALGAAALARGASLIEQAVDVVSPQQEGVDLHCFGGATGLFDAVVIAAGVWSKSLARTLGDGVPLDTERGYNVTLAPGSLGLTRPVLFEGKGFVTTPLDTGDRVGGAVEFGGLNATPNFARVDAMLSKLRPYLPQARLAGGERWMGFRPSLPDSLPVIAAATGEPRVIYAFGHGHYGLTQAAATAELVAGLLARRETLIDLRPFAIDRFRHLFA
jgi:D-amino-acid dehydrogenase